MRPLLTIAAAGVLGVAGVANQAPAVPSAEAVAWVKSRAVPLAPEDAHGFADLQALKAIVGNASIVALGEATHGTREFTTMRHRIVEFLAREMGFTLFAMEGNMPEAEAIGDYVRTGEGDLELLMKGLAFWPWTTEELTDVARWMREYRLDGGVMDFSGVDIQLPAAAQQHVIQFLSTRDSALAARASATYQRLTSPERQFGLSYVELPATPYRGKHITLTGWVRGHAVSRIAALHLRANDASGAPLARATTPPDGGVNGTRDWTSMQVSLDVPADAVTVRAGAVLFGRGDAWFDQLQLVGDGVEPLAIDSESSSDPGFVIDERSRTMPYRAEVDTTIAHDGARSLRISREGPEPLSGNDAVAAANEILEAMEAARGAWTSSATTAEIDWTVQNARFVRQSFEWLADPTRRSREVSMADNLKWLLDRRPPGTKVIVWAHNGHISRDGDALGGILAERFPGQMVNIALTASNGDFMAEGPTGAVQHFSLAPPAPGSVEQIFEAAGMSRFVLDLRTAKPGDPATGWLHEERPYRFVGTRGDVDQFWTGPLASLFDAVIYLRDTTPTTLLK